ncbi:TIGR02206 family membrane protein [Aureibacillus halotolerans]|uniref:Putative integral membrane protein (TIGR02206 family) n=1 Tax=Aureibacillus halotolerans TaxID=1508390 RepID=A0A4R6U290_9BACI|nr:TIGR02206 family membrane protein [Aureibacillus halotolerans]TDQ39756.1 putative integral membrane protein (TIGR02206 family) [Aureibacillus halotolerans]
MIDRFFSLESTGFEFGSLAHIIVLVLTCMIFFFQFHCRRVLLKNDRTWRHIWIGILLVMDGALYVWYLATGAWNPATTLPYNLCSLMLYGTVWMLWRPSKWLAPIIFLLAISGAIQAVLTPELFYGYDHFRFYQFFIAHIGILAANLHLFWTKRVVLQWRAILQAWGVLNVLAASAFLVNVITGGNYFFVSHKPLQGSLLDVLGPYPWYLVSLEGVALLLISFLCILFKLFYRNTVIEISGSTIFTETNNTRQG